MSVNFNRVPADSLKTFNLVGRVGFVNGSVNGDIVIIPENNQLVQPQVAGKRNGFLGNAFHQTAVAVDDISVVAA